MYPPISQAYSRTVAERAFVLRAPDAEMPVRVEFGEPQQDVEVVNGFDWRCPVRITIGSEATVRSIVGVDSLQALQLAVDFARSELVLLLEQPGATLLYLGEPLNASHPDWPRNIL